MVTASAASIDKEATMYTLVRAASRKQLVWQQLPVLSASLVVAEAFYKFHSFTLECAAFLATWYALDAAIAAARALLRRPPSGF